MKSVNQIMSIENLKWACSSISRGFIGIGMSRLEFIVAPVV